jgi:DNA-binding beta-propeller fold protein YncE
VSQETCPEVTLHHFFGRKKEETMPHRISVSFFALTALLAGCSNGNPCHGDLAERAYIVSKDSDEVHVIDTSCWQVTGVVKTGGQSLHMMDLNLDFSKGYVDSSDTDETVVFDARSLAVTSRLKTGKHPTHLTLANDGRFLAVMAEGDDAITFVDPKTDAIIKTLPGFFTPHYMRFTADGRWGWVANIGANHLTRVDTQTLEIDRHLALDGFAGPPAQSAAPDEGGFADAQIDPSGILYAAHHATGRVIVYDTRTDTKLPELRVGVGPWVVFAEVPFAAPLRYVVPNFADATASVINGESRALAGVVPGDSEAYGVNYSPLAPGRAYVMNRVKEEIAVVDVERNVVVDQIPVGGNTETASTTPDGRYIVAAVSRANRVVVIDAQTGKLFKTFDHIGQYPWSVTIPRGQNYCH